SSRTFAAICSALTRISATSSACWGRARTAMSAQLSQVARRLVEMGAEWSDYERRRARKNAIAPRAATASAAAPISSGTLPDPAALGAGVSCAATALGEGDAFCDGAAAADAVALGAAVVDYGVAASVGAGVGRSVGAIVGGAVRTGVGGAVGGAVG